MARQIIRTGIGEVEDVTAVVPSDAQTPQVALGSYTAPTAWISATRVEDNDDDATKTLVLTVGQGHLNPTAGRYWLWWRYLDGSGQELVARSVNSITVDTTAGTPLAAGRQYVELPPGGVIGQVLGLLPDGTLGWLDAPSGSASPNLIFGAGVYGAGVYSPAA